MYRPNDVCNWDFQIPGAAGIEVRTDISGFGVASTLTITNDRRLPLEQQDSSTKVTLQRQVPNDQPKLVTVTSDHLALWFTANGEAGYCFDMRYTTLTLASTLTWIIVGGGLLTAIPFALFGLWRLWACYSVRRHSRNLDVRQQELETLAREGVAVHMGISQALFERLDNVVYTADSVRSRLMRSTPLR